MTCSLAFPGMIVSVVRDPVSRSVAFGVCSHCGPIQYFLLLRHAHPHAPPFHLHLNSGIAA